VNSSDAYTFASEVDRQIESLPDTGYRLKKGRGKVLREELLPLSRLALFFKRPGLSVEVAGHEDNGRADGHIWITGFLEKEFEIQITYIYTHEDSLRDELLNSQGYCPGAGKIKRVNGDIVAEMGGQTQMNMFIG